MRQIFYLVLLILSVNLALGSDVKKVVPKAPLVVKIDTAQHPSIRSFDKETLGKYSKQREFNYEGPATGPSWWTYFWERFWDWFLHLFSVRGLGILGIIWNIIWLLLLFGGVAAIVYFILKASGVDVQDIFKRKSKATAVPYSEFFEDINHIDFDTEIENAVAKHNYRFAVRLLYLKCLKQLSDAGMITWEIDKTNTQYIYELKDQEQRTAFSSLTRQFEFVWYGEFMIDNQVYLSIAGAFRNFNQQKP